MQVCIMDEWMGGMGRYFQIHHPQFQEIKYVCFLNNPFSILFDKYSNSKIRNLGDKIFLCFLTKFTFIFR